MIGLANQVLIYGAYAVTFLTLAAYSAFVVIRGRQLAAEVDDEQKYWS